MIHAAKHAVPTPLERNLWYFIALVAFAAGMYFRIIGIGKWPLATDEYYLYRAITFLLDKGIPEFPCGGYYVRGLVYQYLTAPVVYFGVQAEMAIRLMSSIAGFAVLAAASLLGHRIGGVRIAACVLILLSLSTWEIEMSRFGRMYTFFQAIFLAYCYYLYRIVNDLHIPGWRMLLGLSIFGPLVWEGGVLLPVANFIPMFMGREFWRPRHIWVSVAILSITSAFLSVNFRSLGSSQIDPTLLADSRTALFQKVVGLVPMPAFDLLSTTFAGALFAFGVFALIWLHYRSWLENRSSTELIGFAIISCAVIAGQLLLSVLLIVGLFLVDWISPNVFRRFWARTILIIWTVMSILWVVLQIFQAISERSNEPVKGLIGFPELLYSLLYPWLDAMPTVTVFIILGIGLLTFTILCKASPHRGLNALLAIVVLGVTIIGGAPTQYDETRYSFYLYPLLLILAVTGLTFGLDWSAMTRKASPIVPGLVVLVFPFTSDFAYGHLRNIDTYTANFRVGYEVWRARHYYPRFDFASPAQFITDRIAKEDIVITTNVVIDQYIQDTDYVYLSASDSRFPGQACGQPVRERWTDLPLLYDLDSVQNIASSITDENLWILADEQTLARTLQLEVITNDLGMDHVYSSPDGYISVFQKSASD